MADSVPSEPAAAAAPDVRTTGAWVHVLLSDDQGAEIAAAWSPPPRSDLPTHPHITLVYLWDDATSRLNRADVEATIRDALTERARDSSPAATALPSVFNGLARSPPTRSRAWFPWWPRPTARVWKRSRPDCRRPWSKRSTLSPGTDSSPTAPSPSPR
jgi:hypothetical protein